jgi:hypothetical protein
VQREQEQVAVGEKAPRAAFAVLVSVAAIVFVIVIVAVLMSSAPAAFTAMAATASVRGVGVVTVRVVAGHRRLYLDISVLRYI